MYIEGTTGVIQLIHAYNWTVVVVENIQMIAYDPIHTYVSGEQSNTPTCLDWSDQKGQAKRIASDILKVSPVSLCITFLLHLFRDEDVFARVIFGLVYLSA